MNREHDSEQLKNAPIAAVFADFCKTVAQLRDPESGCPWDLKQDHKTLRTYMLEEAYEAAEAMGGDNSEELCEELGDVLLQVVLNSQIACDQNKFDIVSVTTSINNKMRRRHPHVFASEVDSSQLSENQLSSQWEKIKADEKVSKGLSSSELSIYDKMKSHKMHPSTIQAQKIGELAAANNFDWNKPEEVLNVLKGEIEELNEAMNREDKNSKAEILDEIGDVYFSLAQLCRHLGENPEIVAQGSNDKFLRRFRQVENLARKQGLEIQSCEKDLLQQLWKEAKKQTAT